MATPLYVFANGTTNSGNELWIAGNGLTAPRLLKDIVPGGSSDPNQFTPLADGRVLFTANDVVHGRELWVTDGTEAGTRMLRDIGLGGNTSGPEKLTALPNGTVLFTADNGQNGRELWVTNGTETGTRLLKDIQGGTAASQISDFNLLPNGRVLFTANDGAHGPELWSTDGTAAGTQLVREMTPGAIGSSLSFSRIDSDGRGVFSVGPMADYQGPDWASISGEWRSDGTTSGTTRVSSKYPEFYGQPAGADGELIVYKGFYFGGGSEKNFVQALYVLDGTGSGPKMLLDELGRPGAESRMWPLGNGLVVFSHLQDLWVTDGTQAGTKIIGQSVLIGQWADSFTALGNGKLLFSNAANYVSERGDTTSDLWITDGTTAGTVRLTGQLPNGPAALPDKAEVLPDGTVVFNAKSVDGDNYAVWKVDLTTNAVERLKDVHAWSGAIDIGVLRPDTATDGPQTPREVAGTPSGDTLIHLPGSHTYNGGSGHDVLDMGGVGWRGGTVRSLPDGTAAMNLRSSADILSSVEEVQFADGRLVFDAADPAAQVVRLYQAALHRAPEQHGLNFWTDQISDGASLSRLASGFLDSAEFASRYGTDLNTAGYVEALYNNALGRGSDPIGKAYWVNLINSGALSRAEALVGFSESAENQMQTSSLVKAGIWDVSENAGFVARLYDTALGRLPDVQGLAGWRAQLDSRALTAEEMVNGFVASDEFAARYGKNVSTSEFVELLYINTLDRASDAAGKANWVNVIDGGVMSRADVVLGFSESAEHIARTAPGIMSEDPSHFGIVFA
jgi:ELWxxDGT repeat protein